LATEAAQVAVQSCAQQGLKVTALVVDSAAVPIAMVSADGAAEITQRIAAGKAVTAVRTKLATGEVVTRSRSDAAYLATLAADPAMGPPRQGGVPIVQAGNVVGAIAVSGAPTGAQDEPCARAGLAIVEGRLAANMSSRPLPDAAAVQFVLPADIKWEGEPGSQRAKLWGDPDKPGPYGILYKWEPGHNSQPHYHPNDRFAYVVSGTWWMSTSRTPDKSTLYPVPQGSLVVHKANGVHWDGGVDNTAIILVTGIGPATSIRIAQ
jgi:uncharacterized protein GlcG (DUF336 family)